jgi:hypothetical protein
MMLKQTNCCSTCHSALPDEADPDNPTLRFTEASLTLGHVELMR